MLSAFIHALFHIARGTKRYFALPQKRLGAATFIPSGDKLFHEPVRVPRISANFSSERIHKTIKFSVGDSVVNKLNSFRFITCDAAASEHEFFRG